MTDFSCTNARRDLGNANGRAVPRRGWSLSLFALAVCTCSTASSGRAQGIEAGVRLGYALPILNVDKHTPMSDIATGQVPIAIDLGCRATPELFVGVYGQYGFAFVGDRFGAFCSMLDCSASDVRIDIQAHYHFAAGRSVDPWLGLGGGYEWLSFAMSSGGAKNSITMSGLEFLNLQLGLDIEAAPSAFLGPSMSLSVGRYSAISTECDGASSCLLDSEGELEDASLHPWLMVALRGAYSS